MPVKNAIVHLIDKKPDGSPGTIVLSQALLPATQEVDDLVQDLNETYNAKQSKAWGFFPGESGAYPFTGWLSAYAAGNLSFLEFTSEAANHLLRLKEESSLSIGGHVAFIHYVQGMTDYLLVAELGTRQAVAINDTLNLVRVDHIDVGAMSAAARINISEWQNNKTSKQYISMLAAKSKRRSPFADMIGLQEGVDAKSETRTLLKAFSDYVEAQDVTEESARAQTDTLVGYATSQAKLGDPISLEELSELIDEDRPRAFYEHIRNKDYGLSPQIPPDKRTLSMFQRFTGRSDGLSISFEAHLLGSKIEFDEGRGQLIIRNLPQQLQDQLKRAKSQA